MSEAANAVAAPTEANGQNRITELKVSGHLMTLDTGLFCVFQSPSPRGATTDPACRACGSHCRQTRTSSPTP